MCSAIKFVVQLAILGCCRYVHRKSLYCRFVKCTDHEGMKSYKVINVANMKTFSMSLLSYLVYTTLLFAYEKIAIFYLPPMGSRVNN